MTQTKCFLLRTTATTLLTLVTIVRGKVWSGFKRRGRRAEDPRSCLAFVPATCPEDVEGDPRGVWESRADDSLAFCVIRLHQAFVSQPGLD